jgi:hypothetical protein
MATNWKTIREETVEGDHVIELRYAEFGKGRAKVKSWKIFRDGVQVGYGATENDAHVNFTRATLGFVRDNTTGVYAKAV